MLVERLPLTCERCQQTTFISVDDAQQRRFATCAHCGVQVEIDKDRASCILAALELHIVNR